MHIFFFLLKKRFFLIIEMSAAEYKNYLKNNKQKQDPRNAQVDMKQKFQLFQNM